MQRIFRNPYYSSPSMRFSSTESVRTRELSLAGKRDSRRHFERFPFILKKKKTKKKKNQLFRWGIKLKDSFHWQFWEINRVSQQGTWDMSVIKQIIQ